MPTTKSAIKDMKTSSIKNKANRAHKSKIKTILKKIHVAIESNQKQEAEELLKSIFSLLDRAAKKNLIHKNKANHEKAKVASKVHYIS